MNTVGTLLIILGACLSQGLKLVRRYANNGANEIASLIRVVVVVMWFHCGPEAFHYCRSRRCECVGGLGMLIEGGTLMTH